MLSLLKLLLARNINEQQRPMDAARHSHRYGHEQEVVYIATIVVMDESHESFMQVVGGQARQLGLCGPQEPRPRRPDSDCPSATLAAGARDMLVAQSVPGAEILFAAAIERSCRRR